MKRDTNYTFIFESTIKDPDTGEGIPVEIWKDNVTGAIIGIDASYLEMSDGDYYCPFTGERRTLPIPPDGQLA